MWRIIERDPEVGRDSESGQLIYRQHYDPTLVYDELLRIKETIHGILKTSAEESLSPYEVAIARRILGCMTGEKLAGQVFSKSSKVKLKILVSIQC